MEETKTTVYTIRCNNAAEFRKTISALMELGFFYRKREPIPVSTIDKRYGWSSQIVLYAHTECKRIIMSVGGQGVEMGDFNVIGVESVEKFVELGYHKY